MISCFLQNEKETSKISSLLFFASMIILQISRRLIGRPEWKYFESVYVFKVALACR